MKYMISSVLAGLGLLSLTSLCAAQVTIYAYDIPGLYQEDNGGVYDQIVKQLIVTSGEAELKVLPGLRAEKKFASCKNCCITPANTNPAFYDFGPDVTATEPMNVAEIYVFSKSGSPPIKSVDALKGKQVGIRQGMATSLQSVLHDAQFKIQGVGSIEQNIAKLEKGRIDAFIDFVPDVYLVESDLGNSPMSHSKGEPLERHPDSLACRGVSPEFMDAFNKGLQAMKDSGKLKEILGDSLIEPQ